MTIITYNNKQYIEHDASNPVMTEFTCECGNSMTVPLGGVELGIITTCGHCTTKHGFPRERHQATLTEGWISLTEDEEFVEL